MSPRTLCLLLLVVAGICGVKQDGNGADAPSASPPLTSIAEMRALPGTAFDLVRPISLSGIVTLVDTNRGMLVLEDATGAVALYPDPGNLGVHPGQHVALKASDCAPYILNFPKYPYHSSGQAVMPTFETPDNEGDFRLTRMHGWLHPPATGYYTFWISSDDSSDLWLSTSADPAQVRRIAFVQTGQWTTRHEWNRFPSQRSEPVLLKAGESYYIDALQEQQLAESHLAVAWEGPKFKQEIIDGRFLTPWRAEGEISPTTPGAGAAGGILREYWTNFAVGSVTELTRDGPGGSNFTVRNMEISPSGDEGWPEPQPLEAGRRLLPDDRYRWVKGEGEVRFLASDGTSASVELTVGQSRILVRVIRYHGELPPLRTRLHARFSGVCEGENDTSGQFTASLISVPSEKDIAFGEEADGQAQTAAVSATTLAPPETALGGYYFTRGVVTFDGRVLDRKRLFVQDPLGGVFISQEERHLDPPLQVGQLVAIGGHLLPGKYAPSIRPLEVNVLGWQNLPVPAVLSPEASVASYRDGQWTEFEGVVRSVNSDGTMMLMGKQTPLLAWVGQNGPRGLERFVDSTMRVRGVMSLDTLDTPVLLVPSPNYAATIEPVPELSRRPVPIADLVGADPASGWTHRVKIAGKVTFRSDRYFFLQDDSAGVRVQPGSAPPVQVGSTVEVVGFPNEEGVLVRLTEATWKSLGAQGRVTPENWEPQNTSQSQDGKLVTVEGRLLSQKISGTEQILELQTDQHVCEAVLDAAQTTLPKFAPGSTLAATGVCVEPVAPEAGRNEFPSRSAYRPVRLLLRTPLDVSSLHGPPWWTWQRAAILIGLLLAVLAGSLARLQFQHRRFARQQAARLAFTREMLENQEGERRRIAASLHDSLGQDLLVIRSQASLAIQSADDAHLMRERLTKISDTTLQALQEVREITHDLRPYQLDRLGLTQALRAVVRRMTENCSMALACHLDDVDGLLGKEAEIHVYRIVQEGMNNVVKHSGATEVTVVIKNVSGLLSISIRDNGRGLSTTAQPSDAGFGLSGIRERAEIMGGTARIDSGPHEGANLQIELPLPPSPKCPPPSNC